jgi:LmbE family N-acetylglucosaminyl deacetylase
MTRTILLVAAHPDDEVLGCGGTLARHAANGDDVHVLFFADGTSSRLGAGATDELIRARSSEAIEAAKVMGINPPQFLGFPDQRLDSEDFLDLTRALESVVFKLSPMIVYTHHGSDLNLDHRLAYRAVLTACRPVPGSTVKEIYAFETLSSTEWSDRGIGPGFNPNRFVDISDQLERKLSALAAYGSELREFPHPRSLEGVRALARVRGACVGVEAAEAFEVIRQIKR